MGVASAGELASIISKLSAEKAKYLAEIAEIDRVFSQYGINPAGASGVRHAVSVSVGTAPAKRRGRPKKVITAAAVTKAVPAVKAAAPKKAPVAKNSGKVTGPESIIELVKSKGSAGASTSDIAKHWEGEGRKGNVYNIVAEMVKKNLLKKTKIKGIQGSTFHLA